MSTMPWSPLATASRRPTAGEREARLSFISVVSRWHLGGISEGVGEPPAVVRYSC